MEIKSESEIKTECRQDLSITMKIVKESNRPDKDKIIASLETIDDFYDRWWEI